VLDKGRVVVAKYRTSFVWGRRNRLQTNDCP